MTRTSALDREQRRKQILRFFKRGMSRKDMAQAFGVTDTCMGNWLRAEGLLDPKKVEAGIRGQQARERKAQG